jgi:hypothetical protein
MGDRQQDYAGQIVYETDLLNGWRFAQEADGLLSLDLIGPGPAVSGLACNPTGPATLAVVMSPGRFYQLTFLDLNPYGQITGGSPAGGLGPDVNPNHQILKQGTLRDPVTLPCAAPGTPGTSVNYLIEATFQEIDTTPSVLPFFNTANPATPLAGPNGDGLTLPTIRACQCLVQAKAGVAAATGSQVTPAADAGWIGLYSVTVTQGQTQITSANITIIPGAPFLAPIVGQSVPSGVYAVDTSSTPGTIIAALNPPITAYTPGTLFTIKVANSNPGAALANINSLGLISVVQPDGTAVNQNALAAGRDEIVVVGSGPVLYLMRWPQIPLDKRGPVMAFANTGFACSIHNHYPVDTTGGAMTCTLPASPNYGDEIGFNDSVGLWKSNNLVIGRNGQLINGKSANFTCNLNYASFRLVFRGGSYGWSVE